MIDIDALLKDRTIDLFDGSTELAIDLLPAAKKQSHCILP